MTGWIVMAVLVSSLLVAERVGRPRLEWVLKPAASLTFVVTGVLAGGTQGLFGRTLLAGLVLAALGDVLLIPKHDAAFLGGLVAFLAGHVAYAVAFALRGIELGHAGAALALLVVLGVPVVRWLLPHVERPMKAPVLAYVVVITIMVALAAGTAPRGSAWLLLVGAFAFYCSDLAVARDRFVKASPLNRLWGLPLYFAAQMLLASQANR